MKDIRWKKQAEHVFEVNRQTREQIAPKVLQLFSQIEFGGRPSEQIRDADRPFLEQADFELCGIW